MSIKDYYLICDLCKKRIHVCSLRVNGSNPVDQETLSKFIIEHDGHEPSIRDHESQPKGVSEWLGGWSCDGDWVPHDSP